MAQSLKTIHATCPHDCPDTCSMLVTVKDGKAISLKGNPDHPITKGFLCGKVSRYIERTYHPTRLLHPLKRIGAKGEGRFEKISWQEAIDTVASKLGSIIDSPFGPQSILPYSYAGTMGRLQSSSIDRRFFHRIGASLLERTICATAGVAGSQMTLGARAAIDPEAVLHSKFIINWGSNTSVTNSHLWTIMHRARKAGAKIITIDPFRSKTAEKSDLWIPIRPGTDAALALGIMHVIFRDNLQDQDFIDKYCLGGEDLKSRANDFTPAKVSAITGLKPITIEQLAHEYANTKPAFIRLNYGLQRHGGGGMAVRAITCLPGIIGAWKETGGGAFLSTSGMYPLKAASAFERHDLIPKGTRSINMSLLADALNDNNLAPPIKALIVYNSNPAAVCPDQSKVIRGLKRDDLFTVVLEQFPTDTVDYADIVLPATTQLEHWDLHTSYGHLHVQINEPAIAPLGESLPNTEIFRLLSKAMKLEPELYESTDIELIKEALEPSAGGFNSAKVMSAITFEQLKKEGSMRLDLPKDYAPFANGHFPTPSGKCEFFSTSMQKLGLDPLPSYTPSHEDPQTRIDLATHYPIQLLSPPDPAFLNSSFANLDWQKQDAGRPTLLISPKDAASRGITEEARVRIFNNRGEFLAHAKITDAVLSGVAVAQGLWWNKDIPGKANANATTSTAITDLGAGATFFDNLIEVEPVSNSDI
jgi:anaerobic selenocysteine-containing dehydrogenase